MINVEITESGGISTEKNENQVVEIDYFDKEAAKAEKNRINAILKQAERRGDLLYLNREEAQAVLDVYPNLYSSNMEGDPPSEIKITNHRTQSYMIYWRDHNGKEVRQSELRPKRSEKITTYASHILHYEENVRKEIWNL
eukprot:UN29051